MSDKYISRDNLELAIDGLKVGMTPNWNENDKSVIGYIENRPFYTEYGVIVDNYSGSGKLPKCNFVVGNTYDVIWNGVTYKGLVCRTDGEYNFIGGDRYPFYIDNDGGNGFYVEPESGFTVSILGDIVHQLDEKYIPDGIARVDELEIVFENIDSKKMDANNPVGTGSFSMGRKADSTVGESSHAEGYSTTASGSGSHAEGYSTTASGDWSHAEGQFNVASGSASHAEGGDPFVSGGYTTASSIASHAEGLGTISDGSASHAEGCQTQALSSYSHTEGYGTIAYKVARGGHAEGLETTVGGEYAHAEGRWTKANGYYSHAEGNNTISASKNQHVQGSCNVKDESGKYAHIVGNGTSGDARSNAHTIDWNGVGWFQGGLQVGGNAQDGEGVGYVPAVSAGAQAGQILAVKAVDENGKPTEWEVADMPTDAHINSLIDAKLGVIENGTY